MVACPFDGDDDDAQNETFADDVDETVAVLIDYALVELLLKVVVVVAVVMEEAEVAVVAMEADTMIRLWLALLSVYAAEFANR